MKLTKSFRGRVQLETVSDIDSSLKESRDLGYSSLGKWDEEISFFKDKRNSTEMN